MAFKYFGFGEKFIAYLLSSIFFTARKRSLGQGNIFSSASQEFCSRGGYLGRYPQAGTPPRQVPPRQVHPLGRSTHLGRYTPCSGTPPRQVQPLGRYPPGRYPPRSSTCWEIRPTSGRYASYWNAFLFSTMFLGISAAHSFTL